MSAFNMQSNLAIKKIHLDLKSSRDVSSGDLCKDDPLTEKSGNPSSSRLNWMFLRLL